MNVEWHFYCDLMGAGKISSLFFFQTTKLFGDIGGQLGLWIGISLMTLLEILQFFGEMAVYLCKSRREESIK